MFSVSNGVLLLNLWKILNWVIRNLYLTLFHCFDFELILLLFFSSFFVLIRFSQCSIYIPPESVRKAEFFWGSQRVYKWTIALKWVNQHLRWKLRGLVWPNGWVFVYELSGSGFESSCSHLNFRFRTCFEQGVPWHSGNYRMWIHSEMRTWHDKNIQSGKLYWVFFLLHYILTSLSFVIFKVTLSLAVIIIT